jgi:integrase
MGWPSSRVERRRLHLPRVRGGRNREGTPDRGRIDPSRPIKSWRSAWRAALKRTGLQLRFHDLRHTCITKLAESQASEQTLMAIAGHVSRKMIEHYSHIRMEAKRGATDAIVERGVHQNVHQDPPEVSNPVPKSLN